MTYTFSNQKFDNRVNKLLSWFGINLMVSFQDITQNMFCKLAKISHPADLEIYNLELELDIELYWWRVKYQLCNMLLKIASWGTSRIIMEFPRIFNANLRLRNRWLHYIQTWWDNLLHATDWVSAIIIFHGPNSLSIIKLYLTSFADGTVKFSFENNFALQLLWQVKS